ncbi:MAG: hypothetical protein KBD10_01080 [Candidatus Pacebacteria bacterium]|nr:hypothetical protein [Candidatus Paceibacterota bacterium]
MTEQFPDSELKNAEILINAEQCLCRGGDKTGFCDKECEFRSDVKKQIADMHERNSNKSSEE